MKLPRFKAHPECRACPLGDPEYVRTIGMPTRVWDEGHSDENKDTALLVVGAHPHIEEDKTGKSFVGATGVHTNMTYIKGGGLYKHADVYLSNAIRCYPRDTVTVNKSMVDTCRRYLEEDIRELRRCYSSVVILATGEKAVMSVMGEKVALRAFPQGTKVEIGGTAVTVFATLLATNILPGRDPSKILAIMDHMVLLYKYLRDGYLGTRVRVPRYDRLVGSRVMDPPADVGLVALDIETYGCLGTFPVQRAFHPTKMEKADGVPPHRQIVTCSLTWRDPRPGRTALTTKVYPMATHEDRGKLYRALQEIHHLEILGANVLFDVVCLRACDPRFRVLLNKNRCTLHELQVRNFLENDQRIERSLKNLSLLMGVANYNTDAVNLKKGQRYRDLKDKRLFKYNAKDTISTLLCWEILGEAIAVKFGPGSQKLSDEATQWWNDLLWLIVSMKEAGIHYDVPKLQRVHDILSTKIERLCRFAEERYETPLSGKGSGKAKDAHFQRMILETHRPDSRRVKRTKKGKISANQENLGLLLGVVPPDHPDRRLLNVYRYYAKWSKVVSSYTSPLLGLTDPDSDNHWEGRLYDGRAYPSWYPVPMAGESRGEFGGTQQGRITSKYPATQTQPPIVERCQVSRFPDGRILRVDESQIELRVATMWSGDPEFLRIFQTNLNVHLETAQTVADILGLGMTVTKKDHPKWYHAGKTLNFLMLFLGGWRTFQETVLREVDMLIPQQDCQSIIAGFNKKHQGQRDWQRDLIRRASLQTYIETPVSGLSRSFLGDVEESYVSMICNLPVQEVAAKITLSAQVALEDWLRLSGLRTLTVANTYDEGIYDCPPDETEEVREKALAIYRCPPILERLYEEGLHPVPLDVTAEIC